VRLEPGAQGGGGFVVELARRGAGRLPVRLRSRLRQPATKAVKAAPGSSSFQPGSSFHSADCRGFSGGLGGSTTGHTGQAGQAAGAGQAAAAEKSAPARRRFARSRPQQQRQQGNMRGEETDMNLLKWPSFNGPQA
jgi:hypothetical protein